MANENNWSQRIDKQRDKERDEAEQEYDKMYQDMIGEPTHVVPDAPDSGNTVLDELIDDDDFIGNLTENGKLLFEVLREHGQEFFNNFAKGVKHFTLPQAAQNIAGMGEQMEEGYQEYGTASSTVPAFVKGVKESIVGEPDPRTFGGPVRNINPNEENDVNTLSTKDYMQWRKEFINRGKNTRPQGR